MRATPVLLMLAVFLILCSCESNGGKSPTAPAGSETSQETGRVVFNISFAPWKEDAAKPAAVAAVDSIVAYVYDTSDNQLAEATMTISGGAFSGTVTVPALGNLRVMVVFYDGGIVRYIGQDSDVDVPVGGEATADISVKYMGTSVTAPKKVNAGDSYPVSWMERPFATGYELQEAYTANFTYAQSVYSGSNTTTTLMHEEGTTCYYRARVQTVYGYGPWHSTGGASTGIQAHEGTVIIGGDLPPDEPANLPAELAFVPIPATTVPYVISEGFSVTISAFQMSTTEVTNAQYAQYLNAAFASGDVYILVEGWSANDVYGATGEWSGKRYLDMGYDDNAGTRCCIIYNGGGIFSVESGKEHLPVEAVTWYGAKAFAKYNGYDLPTEAEWQYAASGGMSYGYGTADGSLSMAGANYGNNIRRPVNVGSYPANPFGLYDMAGNVREWCSDYREDYPSGTESDYAGPLSGSVRVQRGGGWNDSGDACRVDARGSDYPDDWNYSAGFRVVSRWSFTPPVLDLP